MKKCCGFLKGYDIYKGKLVKIGSFMFIREFWSRIFDSLDEVILKFIGN